MNTHILTYFYLKCQSAKHCAAVHARTFVCDVCYRVVGGYVGEQISFE